MFNYLQILRLFSESTDSIGVLKVDLAEAKKHLSARNKQLHQLWYRSVTLRHIISLLDQIEDIAKVCFFSLHIDLSNCMRLQSVDWSKGVSQPAFKIMLVGLALYTPKLDFV